jgi:hypothetical protein
MRSFVVVDSYAIASLFRPSCNSMGLILDARMDWLKLCTTFARDTLNSHLVSSKWFVHMMTNQLESSTEVFDKKPLTITTTVSDELFEAPSCPFISICLLLSALLASLDI